MQTLKHVIIFALICFALSGSSKTTEAENSESKDSTEFPDVRRDDIGQKSDINPDSQGQTESSDFNDSRPDPGVRKDDVRQKYDNKPDFRGLRSDLHGHSDDIGQPKNHTVSSQSAAAPETVPHSSTSRGIVSVTIGSSLENQQTSNSLGMICCQGSSYSSCTSTIGGVTYHQEKRSIFACDRNEREMRSVNTYEESITDHQSNCTRFKTGQTLVKTTFDNSGNAESKSLSWEDQGTVSGPNVPVMYGNSESIAMMNGSSSIVDQNDESEEMRKAHQKIKEIKEEVQKRIQTDPRFQENEAASRKAHQNIKEAEQRIKDAEQKIKELAQEMEEQSRKLEETQEMIERLKIAELG